MLEIVAVNAVVMLAAALQASTGIGFAMVAVPLLGLIDLAWLPGPMLAANIALSVTMLLRGWNAIERSEAPPLGAGLVIGTLIGTSILAAVPAERLGLLFGIVILLAVGLSLGTPRLPINRATLLAGGTAGGITGVVAAMHGPPLILLLQREPTEKIRATMAGVFVFGCILALGSLALAGLFGWREVRMGLSLLPGIALGYLVGRALGARLSRGAARGAMLTVSGIGGLVLFLRSL